MSQRLSRGRPSLTTVAGTLALSAGTLMASAGTPYRLAPATFTPVGAYSQSLRYEYDRASCDKRSADRDSRKAVKHGNDGESRIQSCAFLCVKCAIGWPRHALECDMIDVPAEATVLCPICRPIPYS